MKKNVFEGYEITKSNAENCKRQIADLEKKIKRIEEEGSVKDSVTGGMGGKEHFKIEGFPITEYERFLITYRERKKNYETMLWEMENQINEIQEIMNGIDDPLVKAIVQYRVIERRSWENVAIKIGCSTSAESVRKIYDRFMDKTLNKSA